MTDDNLTFSLRWSASDGASRRLTTADLAISLGEEVIWPVEGVSGLAVEIQADDLLSHLTEFWTPLVLRQTYPIGARPERPSLLRVEAERRWSGQPAAVAEREDGWIIAFEEAHDLSRCFAGQFDLAPFWLFRAAERMIVETRSALRTIPFGKAHEGLVKVGDQIAFRLKSSGDERWADLVEAWHGRDQGEPAVLLAWSTGLDREIARQFTQDGLLSAPTSVTDAARDDDELRVAARMASALPPEQIRQIIDLVGGFAKRAAPQLDAFGALAAEHISRHFADHRPYEQGEAAANFLRERLSLGPVRFIDIFELLDELGADLHQRAVQPSTLFALAVWGQNHGPAVLLNEGGFRPVKGELRRDGAARVTLAHELCHLLLDRGHGLGAVEILNSRMPLDVEQRAKSFAGELLLPARAAADAWHRAKAPRSVASLATFVRSLCRRYGVTRSVAAWKLEHGLQRDDVDLRVLLDAVVPNR